MATRRSAQTQIQERLGSVAEFPPDELPTLKSVLKKWGVPAEEVACERQ